MMKHILLNASCQNDVGTEGETVRLTLHGNEREAVEIELSKSQIASLNARRTRSFYIRCKKEKILQEIDNAGSSADLEALATNHDLCDACDFLDINIYGAKRALRVIVGSLYRYPRLRSKLCFIGTHNGLERLLIRLENGEEGALKQLHLQYICTTESASKVGGLMHTLLSEIIQNHEVYVASALSAFGLLDSVLLDKNDYDGYAYLHFVSDLRRNEASGFHPQGCASPESVIYHELGHLLDGMCKLSDSAAFQKYYGCLDREDIRNGLSQYALESPKELIAEAFAEFMCSPTPRAIATNVGRLLDSAYQNAFKR